MLVGIAHCPAFGVNVYATVPTTAVFITAGDQTPAIAGRLVEDGGNEGATPPWQILGIAANVGTI